MEAIKGTEKGLYLVDFIRGLMEYSEEKGGRTTFPPHNHMAWHVLLWELKQASEESGRQLPFTVSDFDWDGDYPKNQALAEILAGLLLICSIRSDGRLILNLRKKDVGKANCLAVDYPELAELAYQIASNTPDFFAD